MTASINRPLKGCEDVGKVSRNSFPTFSTRRILIVGLIVVLILIPQAFAYVHQQGSHTTTQTIVSANAKAFIAYASNTGSYLMAAPKGRTWTGLAWSNLEELGTSGSTVRWIRAAHCPLTSRYYEKIVVSLSSDGYLTAQVWNGNTWLTADNIGEITSAGTAYCSFDVAYETSSGGAMLVYAVDSTSSIRDLAYRIWDGSSWSAESYIDDPSHSTNIGYRWVELESNPISTSNEIALIAVDQTNADCNAWIWDGAGWGNFQELENALSGIRDNKCIGLAYEQTSGKAMFGWCYSTDVQFRRWNGVSWEDELPSISITTLNVRWLSLKADPQSNMIMALTIDGQNDLNTVLWDGSAWGSPFEHDDGITHIDKRCADFEWEPSGSKGLIVYSMVSGVVTFKTFSAPSTWGSVSTVSNAGTHPWIQLRRNPRAVSEDVKIFGATLNSNDDLWGFRWNGSTLTFEAQAFTLDTSVTTYECFDLAIRPHMSPLN